MGTGESLKHSRNIRVQIEIVRLLFFYIAHTFKSLVTSLVNMHVIFKPECVFKFVPFKMALRATGT